jgi:hypothetical protein
MSNDEIYQILKELKADIQDALKGKSDKTDVNRLWRVMFSLFGVNIFGIILLILAALL